MRLWLKIALTCATVLLAVMLIACFSLLSFSQNNILSLTVSNAKEKQASLAKSFISLADLAVSPDMDSVTRTAEILACFASYADESAVLVSNGKTLYSYVDTDPADILPLSTNDQRVFLDEIGARNLLIVGSRNELSDGSAPFSIYIVRDISSVYQTYHQLRNRFLIASAFFVAIGAGIIIFLVQKESRPLKRLGLTAKRIASGEYGERAAVHTHDEVGELADDFNRMAEAVETHIAELEERNTSQKLFVSGLTHEFKTPMTSMMLHSETLLNLNLPKAQQEKSLNHIYSQCKWLEQLTQKLLGLITLGKAITPAPSSVPDLFERVRESTAETLSKRETPLMTDAGSVRTLNFDADLMQSLLINLVDNASKASEAGQTIELTADDHTLTVRDHGRGIPEDALKRITEPFFMVDQSRSKKQGGSGLGLALVSRIAEAHGAKLTIESKEGEGSSFSVTLP